MSTSGEYTNQPKDLPDLYVRGDDYSTSDAELLDRISRNSPQNRRLREQKVSKQESITRSNGNNAMVAKRSISHKNEN
jgi:hypothetical protein